jgi:hypothetical protein
VFIAVNSGNGKSDVEGYAKETKFEWPILVDQSREYEKANMKTEISLKNIMETVLITPEGSARTIAPSPSYLKKKLEEMLPTAKMTFDGVVIPLKLKSAADDIELGLFEAGIPQVLAAQKAGKELGDSAGAMFDKLKVLAEGRIAKAKELEGAGSKYAAWAEYGRVAVWFKGTEFERPAAAAQAELKKDKSVQDEIAAQQMLGQAKALLSSGKKADKPAAAGALAALQKKYPATDAAKEAAKLAESAK